MVIGLSLHSTWSSAYRCTQHGHRPIAPTSAPTVQNIVAFFAIAIDQSSAEMKVMTVLELCANGSVDDYIFNSHIAISWRQKLELCFLISNGMAFLHSKGIMHRGQCTVHTPKQRISAFPHVWVSFRSLHRRPQTRKCAIRRESSAKDW
jgi:hypothetical protein